MAVNLKSLIGKLNDPTRAALEAAAGLCLSRTHYNIEVEHMLMKMLDSSDNDVARIFHALRRRRLAPGRRTDQESGQAEDAATRALRPSAPPCST